MRGFGSTVIWLLLDSSCRREPIGGQGLNGLRIDEGLDLTTNNWMNTVLIGSNGNTCGAQLRFLCPTDVPKVKQLCREWFPIEYPDPWYDDITSNPKFFALAAVSSLEIMGFIVAEIKCQSRINREDQGLLAYQFPNTTRVAYILTLGVIKERRRNGIASLLLDNLINHLSTNPTTRDVKAIYLHVLVTNTVAISFYERRQFRRHLYLPLYYSINGTARDGFSYVLYINGGNPPFSLLYPFQRCFGLLRYLCPPPSPPPPPLPPPPSMFPERESRCTFLNHVSTDYLSPFYQYLIHVNPCRWMKSLVQRLVGAMARLATRAPLTPRDQSHHLANC